MNEIQSDSPYKNLFEIIENKRANLIDICIFYENFERKSSLNNENTITLSEHFAGLIKNKFPNIKSKNIIISLDNTFEFVISLFACSLTGNFAVPVANKSLLAKEDYIELIENIFFDSDASIIITTESSKKYLPLKYHSYILTVEELRSNQNFRIPFKTDFSSDETFFIQYSSGSTRSPKGVIITHANLMANLEQIKRSMNLDPQIDSTLSWLPLHHDMGLVGMVFSAYYNTGTAHIMGPIDFIKSPYKWLKKVSDLKVSIINSPNSGYHSCLNNISDDDIKTLDLSAIRAAMSGAEPVNASVIKKFTQKFSACGLKENVFFPVYGLAESTLAVTFPKLGESVIIDTVDFNQLIKNQIVEVSTRHPEHIEIVSCGSPLHLTEIKIINDQNIILSEKIIGEIAIRGPSTSTGYFKADGSIDKIKDNSGWCRTGDLGYIKNNNLFITGRKKDLIIINGKNYSPHDLELKASAVPTIRMGRIVICSCILPQDEKEKVYIIAESSILSKKKRQKVKTELIAILGKIVPIKLDQIYLIPPFHTKKTTSGKVKRYLMKELLLKGEIKKYEDNFLKKYLKSRLFILNFLMKNIKN